MEVARKCLHGEEMVVDSVMGVVHGGMMSWKVREVHELNRNLKHGEVDSDGTQVYVEKGAN